VHDLVVFFFQAEDGIRDLIVTGVQTCALPILLTGVFAETTSTFAPLPTSATGARSFFVSKGSILYSDTLIALGGAATRSVWPSRSEERRVGKEGRAPGGESV